MPLHVLIPNGVPIHEVDNALHRLAILGGRAYFLSDGNPTRPATHVLVPSWAHAVLRIQFLTNYHDLLSMTQPIDVDMLKTLSIPSPVPTGPTRFSISPTPSLTLSMATPPTGYTSLYARVTSPPNTPPFVPAALEVSDTLPEGWVTTPRATPKRTTAKPYDRTPTKRTPKTPSRAHKKQSREPSTPPPKASPRHISTVESDATLVADLKEFAKTVTYPSPWGVGAAFREAFWAKFIMKYPKHTRRERNLVLQAYHTDLEGVSINFAAGNQNPRADDEEFLAAFSAFVPSFPWEDTIIRRTVVQAAFLLSEVGEKFATDVKSSYWTHFFKRFRPIWNETHPRMFDMETVANVPKTPKKRKARSTPRNKPKSPNAPLDIQTTSAVIPTPTRPTNDALQLEHYRAIPTPAPDFSTLPNDARGSYKLLTAPATTFSMPMGASCSDTLSMEGLGHLALNVAQSKRAEAVDPVLGSADFDITPYLSLNSSTLAVPTVPMSPPITPDLKSNIVLLPELGAALDSYLQFDFDPTLTTMCS